MIKLQEGENPRFVSGKLNLLRIHMQAMGCHLAILFEKHVANNTMY